MTTTAIGSGIVSAPSHEQPEALLIPFPTPEQPVSETGPFTPPDSGVEELISSMRNEFAAAVADVERRLGQARELERSASGTQVVPRSIHAEDLNIGRPLIDGYLMTANSPGAGSIAWSSLHVVLLGVDYTIADGNTANKYAWFIKPGSGTTATLQTGNTLPVLSPVDALIFVNNAGVPISALETTISYAVGPGVIGAAQLDAGVSTILSTLQSNDIALQSAIDGAITTYAADNPPWPTGSPSPAGGNVNQGDVWYDLNDGGAFRWTGTSGSPVNTWFKIADTDNSALAGKLAYKTTTYLLNNSPGPVAPSGGFTTGDLWMVIDLQNLMRRWTGSAWVDLQIGDGAISGISGPKVGSGINAGNVTTGTLAGVRVGTGVDAGMVTAGTLAAARVGPGVAGAVLNSATGSLTAAGQLGPGVVTPSKINAAFHLLY